MIFTKSHQMNSDKKTQYKSYRLYKSLIKDKNKKLQNNYKKMNFQRKNDENFLNEDENGIYLTVFFHYFEMRFHRLFVMRTTNRESFLEMFNKFFIELC